jgi:hypothetical protein
MFPTVMPNLFRHPTRYVTNFPNKAVNLSYGMPIGIGMTGVEDFSLKLLLSPTSRQTLNEPHHTN